MDVIYLSVEAVEIFHERALREHGGSEGLRSRELLESAVFQPQQSAFGDDAYQSIDRGFFCTVPRYEKLQTEYFSPILYLTNERRTSVDSQVIQISLPRISGSKGSSKSSRSAMRPGRKTTMHGSTAALTASESRLRHIHR